MPSKVIYKRFDNQAGPEYNLPKKEIIKIVYQNGTTDVFNPKLNGAEQTDGKKNAEITKSKSDLGNNIVTFIPGAYSWGLMGNMNDPGVGICYERILEKNGHISVVLPVMYNFTSEKDFSYYSVYSSSSYSNGKSYHSISFIPGVKFYPASSKQRIRYALGLSIFATFGSEPYSAYIDNYSISSYSLQPDWHYSLYGLMISNSLNASVTKNFFLGVDVNAGVPVSDNRREDVSPIAVVFSPVLQFALKIGLRF
jgi:hypothetical protein